ncbi:MAG: ATP-binding cassette domain-containing protein [Xanthomonadales bacterium]|nr:ATP-binding cassette domain-containing protein [Gammaproteobacteria bacterium]MBT8051164.1 ATP-binding cassette domain-containing protein [Gammaproteobacteria bacterium]MBT8055819.1 ATP-binding cassette domain-containing protein [Gammaproteobacteria bacterium]NNJ77657.1 ATP-binding cassette domain-containing protein [Xanthomonadales bacterium]NNL04298.1 ATP-binding cassette domain-containing protein [Xanthomonadales bacterium]
MSKPVLRVQDLSVTFTSLAGSVFNRQERQIRAVDGINFELFAGETLGIVGESGCGKSTLARAILGLLPPNRGRVMWMGDNLTELDEEAMRQRRKELQIVFQDPVASLDPRMTAGDIISEPLWTFYPKMARLQVDERTRGMMKMVGLLPNQINRYPHEFSGGQCQRIGIARSLVLNPRLLICDEPVSALDVSIQAQIVNLLQDLQKKLGLALIFVAHDLSVVRHISDRVMVMYMGQAMEVSEKERLYRKPLHPYTNALMKSVPVPDPKLAAAARRENWLTGDMPSPYRRPKGCVFHDRCPFKVKRCEADVPPLRRMENGDRVACHRAEDLDLSVVEA